MKKLNGFFLEFTQDGIQSGGTHLQAALGTSLDELGDVRAAHGAGHQGHQYIEHGFR